MRENSGKESPLGRTNLGKGNLNRSKGLVSLYFASAAGDSYEPPTTTGLSFVYFESGDSACTEGTTIHQPVCGRPDPPFQPFFCFFTSAPVRIFDPPCLAKTPRRSSSKDTTHVARPWEDYSHADWGKTYRMYQRTRHDSLSFGQKPGLVVRIILLLPVGKKRGNQTRGWFPNGG